jgi:hypothetical protein
LGGLPKGNAPKLHSKLQKSPKNRKKSRFEEENEKLEKKSPKKSGRFFGDFFRKKHESIGKNRLLKKCVSLSYPPRFFGVLFDI